MKLLSLLASSVFAVPVNETVVAQVPAYQEQVPVWVNPNEEVQMPTWVNETEVPQVPVHQEQVGTWVNPNEAPQVESFANETAQVPVVETQVPVWVNPNEQPQMQPWVNPNATVTYWIHYRYLNKTGINLIIYCVLSPLQFFQNPWWSLDLRWRVQIESWAGIEVYSAPTLTCNARTLWMTRHRDKRPCRSDLEKWVQLGSVLANSSRQTLIVSKLHALQWHLHLPTPPKGRFSFEICIMVSLMHMPPDETLFTHFSITFLSSARVCDWKFVSRM